MKKSDFEKAAAGIGRWSGGELYVQPGCRVGPWTAVSGVAAEGLFREEGGRIVFSGPDGLVEGVPANRSSGEIRKFIFAAIRALGNEAFIPTKFSNSGKDFEELCLKEAGRLEKMGVLTMGRYGVQGNMFGGEWAPVDSLPDFEGALASGRQFIMEAKVCSWGAFRMRKQQIKHRQLRHMLRRSAFRVPCYLLLHFNERLGKTFYEPPFTTAIPVKPASAGGWPVFEEFAFDKEKDREHPSLSRELALEIGTLVDWFIPPRNRVAVPDLEALLPPA